MVILLKVPSTDPRLQTAKSPNNATVVKTRVLGGSVPLSNSSPSDVSKGHVITRLLLGIATLVRPTLNVDVHLVTSLGGAVYMSTKPLPHSGRRNLS